MFGKPDGVDRLVQAILAAVAAFALLLGFFMLFDPLGWYDAVGTVKETGPANPHFIKDIGLAFVASGVMIGYAAMAPALRWGSAMAGNLWLSAHGLLHIWEAMTEEASMSVFWQEAPGVLGPPLLVFIAVIIQLGRERASAVPLPKSMFVKFAKKQFGESVAYLDELARTGGFAIEGMQHAMVLAGHHYHAPSPLVHMARLGAMRAEDCGPCVEIARAGALADGMNPARLQNALMGQPDSENDALAFDFAHAIASNDVVRAAELGEEVEQRYGHAVRAELSLTAAISRLFPAIKRGLGYAASCTIPVVNSQKLEPKRVAAETHG